MLSKNLLLVALGSIGAVAVLILCTILPFLPGRYDSFAVPVSMTAQVFGWFGLALVPVGLAWLLAESRPRGAVRRYVLAVIATIAASIVWIGTFLAAMSESAALGIGGIALGAYALSRLLPRLSSLRHTAPVSASAVPLYLILVPVAVLLLQRALEEPVSAWSRNRAIRNSASLIADIERYRSANGRYPLSIVSVHPDYQPSVAGIQRYQYERSGEAYNLLFEQTTLRLGTKEIVMYNPRDEQAVSSHAMDVLQLSATGLALDRTRGHYAVRDAAHPHWKYFWFD